MTRPRTGDFWFVTFSGGQFWPLDPRADEIFIKDIAHALSLQTRWNGHCTRFYSIADHSLMCAHMAAVLEQPLEVQRWALMHDAAEAYTGDIIRPIKHSLFVSTGEEGVESFKGYEERLLRTIAERFDLPWPIPAIVHEIDNRMLVTEAVALTRFWKETHWAYTKPWADLKPFNVELPKREMRDTWTTFRRVFGELFAGLYEESDEQQESPESIQSSR